VTFESGSRLTRIEDSCFSNSGWGLLMQSSKC
jgi:hypothetical protein